MADPRISLGADGVLTLIGWDRRSVKMVLALYERIGHLGDSAWRGSVTFHLAEDTVAVEETRKGQVTDDDLLRLLQQNCKKRPAA